MRKTTATIASNAIARAILSILLGLFLTIFPGTATVTLAYILVVYLAVLGIFSIFSYFRQKRHGASNQGTIILAIFLLVLAVVVFIFPGVVAGLLTLIFGVLLIVSGLINTALSISLRAFTGRIWAGLFILSLCLAIGGVIIIANPFDAAITFVFFLGILFIAKGIVDLVVYVFSRKKEKSMLHSRNLRGL